jgi:hypothetical protein
MRFFGMNRYKFITNSKVFRAFAISIIVGIIVSAIGLTFSTAHAEHIHHEILSEIKEQKNATYPTIPNLSVAPVPIPNILPHPEIDDVRFAKIMKGYIVVMMSKAIQLMDKETSVCQPNTSGAPDD